MDAIKVHDLRDASTDALTLALEDGYVRLFKTTEAGAPSVPYIRTAVEYGIDIPSRSRVQVFCELSDIKEATDFIIPGFFAREYAERMTAFAGLDGVRQVVKNDGTFVMGPARIAIPFGARTPYRCFECNLTVLFSEVPTDSRTDIPAAKCEASVNSHFFERCTDGQDANTGDKPTIRLGTVIPASTFLILYGLLAFGQARMHAWLAATLCALLGIGALVLLVRSLRGRF